MISPISLPPKVAAGSPILAEHWNDMLSVAQSLQVQLTVADPAGPITHPWKVTASQIDRETLRVDVRPGCVNDQAATIVWKVNADPRGEMPAASRAAHAAALAKTPGNAFLKDYWDRPLHEEEPPFLTLPISPTAQQWTLSTRARVPAALRDSASPEARFFLAGVVLAAFPFTVVCTVPMPKRFRVYAGKADPVAINQARVGELLQIARIWQVREGDDLSTISVSQDVFWNVSCMAVEPALSRIDHVSTPLTGIPMVDAWSIQRSAWDNAIADATNSQIDMIESSLTTIEFWTT